jgi:thymidylate synthase (FAD)
MKFKLPNGQEAIFTSEITVEPIQHMGGDHMVVAAARVSVSGTEAVSFADPSKVEESAGLINYLMKQRHGTPFEHGGITFFVNAPIFVWREWHRHRVGFSYNEESGRYKQLEPKFWIPASTRKMVPTENYKAARPTFQAGTPEEHVWIVNDIIDSCSDAYTRYQERLDRGYAKEVARVTLPLNIFSSCWVTCNPRSLMAYLSLRTHDAAAQFVSYPQAEIEEAARIVEKIFKEYWPITYAAFVKNGRVGP